MHYISIILDTLGILQLTRMGISKLKNYLVNDVRSSAVWNHVSDSHDQPLTNCTQDECASLGTQTA